MGTSNISRRGLLRVGVGATCAMTVGKGLADSREHSQPDVTFLQLPLVFTSPPLEPYVDELPIPPRRPIGGTVAIRQTVHQFHRDLAPAPSWAYGDVSHLGPTFVAVSGQHVPMTFVNELPGHIFADDIDLSHHGTSTVDFELPPVSVHLHGAPNRPEHDGHAMDFFRPGTQRVYEFNNDMPACTLWMHDHAMGNTRLNVYAGLATQYWIRDQWDTGEPDNPLDLPFGPYEIPLTIQDKIFKDNGELRYQSTPVVPQDWWQGGFCGDVLCVNGKAWPNLNVDRNLYRFRILNGSPLNTYTFYFSNGMPMYVIGSDGGLLDAPVETDQITIAAAERYDILVDFSNFAPDTKIQLLNDEMIVWPGQLLGSNMIPNVMQFTVQDQRGFSGNVPSTLRGRPHQPPRLPPLPKPEFVRDASLNWLVRGRLPFSDMNMNNLGYMDEPIEHAKQGRVELWNFVNNTSWDHTLHLHLVQFRVLGRQNYSSVLLELFNPRPQKGTRWAPSADPFTTTPMEEPLPEEEGWKDTVRCPPSQITRILVRFPDSAELGFDPDQVFGVDEMRQPLQGYVWHCHILDHEDHEMMLRFRVVP